MNYLKEQYSIIHKSILQNTDKSDPSLQSGVCLTKEVQSTKTLKLVNIGRSKSVAEKQDFEKMCMEKLDADGRVTRLLDIAKVQHHLYLVSYPDVHVLCIVHLPMSFTIAIIPYRIHHNHTRAACGIFAISFFEMLFSGQFFHIWVI